MSVIAVIEDPVEVSDDMKGRNTWYKLSFGDFDDGNYHSCTKDATSISVYVPRFFKGQQVILDGPFDGETEGPLDEPPGETLYFSRNYKIIGANGVLVRQGSEISSAEVCSIRPGDVVHAVEENFNSEGTLRLKIDQPVAGYISKLFGLVERLPDTEDKGGNETGGSGGGPSFEMFSMELLEKLEDNLEMITANDAFNKECRFFGSLQGNQYMKFTDKNKSLSQSVYHKRLRISGSSSYQSYMQGSIGSTTLAQLDDSIVKILRVLRILYSRRFLLALFLLSAGDLLEGRENGDECDLVALVVSGIRMNAPVQGVIDNDSAFNPVSVADHLFNFLRLLVFRGEPYSYSGLETLAFNDIVGASLSPWSVSIEQILEHVLVAFIRRDRKSLLDSSEALAFTSFQDGLILKLYDSIIRNIRLACASKYLDYCWADASYEEDLDEELPMHPNLNYASWLTAIITKHCRDEVIAVLYKAWTIGLRGSSVSQKNIVLNVLSFMTSYISSTGNSKLLDRCLHLLPIQRLTKLGAKRLWQELEDHPSYSRFLQSMISFLTDIQLAASSVQSSATIVSGEESSPRPLTNVNNDFNCNVEPSFKRSVIQFSSTKSHIVFNPQKDLNGPWTVEFWLKRKREILEPVTSVSEDRVDVASTPSPPLKAQYLLSGAKNSYVKIQSGGRIFDLAEENLADEAIKDEAFCISIGQQGSTEKVFDCSIPFDEWIHIALVCQVSPIGMITLYVNGEVRDSASYTIALPLSCIGSTHDLSFLGELGEVRIWSVPRSPSEILRDLNVDVNGAKYLMALLRCNDGSGQFANDCIGNFNFCKLVSCDWIETSGLQKQTSRPLLDDFEDYDILYGDEIHPHGYFSEFTGVASIPAVLGAEGELANPISEVVCLSYRLSRDQSQVAEDGTSYIEGHLHWCERNVRSRLTGTISPTSSGKEAIKLSIPAKATFDGAPEKLEWLQSLTFEGFVVDGEIKGSFSTKLLVDVPNALDPGQARIDKFSISSSVRYTCETKKGVFLSSTGVEQLKVADTADEGQYVVQVEIVPYKKIKSGNGVETGAGSDKDLENADERKFGICGNEGSLWLEWLIVSSGGSIGFGACTEDALNHPDACVDANDSTWTYSVSGQASHGMDFRGCENADDGDIIGMQIDSDLGTITFYKNNDFVVEFSSINDHASMSKNGDRQIHLAGIRPFVSLTSPGDCVSFIGLKSGPIELGYPSSILGELSYELSSRSKQYLGSKLFCQVKEGSINGMGLQYFIESKERWFGSWENGFREGLHAHIVDAPTPEEQVTEAVSSESNSSNLPPALVPLTSDNLPPQTPLPETASSIKLRVHSTKFYRKGEEAVAPTTEEIFDDQVLLKAFMEDFIKAKAKDIPNYMLPPCIASVSPSLSSSTIGGSLSPPWSRRDQFLASTSSHQQANEASTLQSEAAALALPNPFRFAASPASTEEKINVRVHDGGLDEFIFRIPRNIIFQKIIDAYASRKTFPTSSLVFKLKDTVLQGDRTVDSYDMEDNSIINVSIRSITSNNWREINEFIDTSTAPFVLKIVYDSGATVRSGVEIEDNAPLRTLRNGEIVEAFKHAFTTEKISRYQIADGWISERLRGGTEAKVIQMLYERLLEPTFFKVLRQEGAKIRKNYSLDSEDLGFCPQGTILTVTEKRYIEVEKDEYTIRVKIVSPPEWRGWASLKEHLLELVSAPPSTAESAADPAIIVEMDRRAKLHAQRKLRAKMRAKLIRSKSLRRTVESKGSFDLSKETFFLLRKSHRSAGDRSDRGGPKVSADFCTVTGDDSGSHRSLAFGSRGFSRGIHYW